MVPPFACMPKRLTVDVESSEKTGFHASPVCPFRSSVVAAIDHEIATAVTVEITQTHIPTKGVSITSDQECFRHRHSPVQDRIFARSPLRKLGSTS